MNPWYDVLKGNVVPGFGNVGLLPILYHDDVYGTVNTKKDDKIVEPVEELYNKVMPKKPLEIKVCQNI